jgi:predicted metalloprotease with PDZ domain
MSMTKTIFIICMIAGTLCVQAQLTYTLRYRDSTSPFISVRIEAGKALKAPVQFIMPRSVPGAYSILTYDMYIDKVNAINMQGKHIPMERHASGAPRWAAPVEEAGIMAVEYRVNIDRMERDNAPSDASLIRPGFAGILNYSVFGWIEGLDSQALACRVETFADWPVFSTNMPVQDPAYGSFQFQVNDYPALADGQIFMGPRIQLKSFPGKVPLYVVSYAQTINEYLDDYGSIGMECMAILDTFYGALPFPHYTLVLSKALQPDNRVAPPFAMEHLNSGTFMGDTTGLQTGPMMPVTRRRTLSNFLHHMAHAYIPLRCYSDHYRPRPLELPPLVETIWLNEGSGWFILHDILKSPAYLQRFRSSVYETAAEIRALSMTELSGLASTMYSLDFRTGQAAFSRGALMFIEMDAHIRLKTSGQKSMRDVFRYLWQQSRRQTLPFSRDQLPELMSEGSGVDLSSIYQKWMGRIE